MSLKILTKYKCCLVAIIPTPSTATATSVIVSELAGPIVGISARLVILSACLMMMGTVTAESGAVLRPLLAVHLVVQMARVSPKGLLLVLKGEWWR